MSDESAGFLRVNPGLFAFHVMTPTFAEADALAFTRAATVSIDGRPVSARSMPESILGVVVRVVSSRMVDVSVGRAVIRFRAVGRVQPGDLVVRAKRADTVVAERATRRMRGVEGRARYARRVIAGIDAANASPTREVRVWLAATVGTVLPLP